MTNKSFTEEQKKCVREYLEENDTTFDIDKLMKVFPSYSLKTLFEIIDSLNDEGLIEIL